MTKRIQICQGCKHSLKTPDNSIPDPPCNYCIARKERRSYYDSIHILQTPSRESDTHYHINDTCIKCGDPSFDPN